MSLYVIGAAALSAALVAGGGAWQVQEWRYGAKETERLQAIERQRRFAEKRVDVAAGGHEADKREIEVEYREIEKEVERVVEKTVYRDACLDDDGLRVLSNALGAPGATDLKKTEPSQTASPAAIPFSAGSPE